MTSSEGATPAPWPSPQEWRDVWIYMILVDRFNNPAHAVPEPASVPWDQPVIPVIRPLAYNGASTPRSST